MNNCKMTDLELGALATVEGGSFVYDLGRSIRFFALAGPTGNYLGVAVGDWIATNALK